MGMFLIILLYQMPFRVQSCRSIKKMIQKFKVGEIYKIRRLASAIDRNFRSKLLSMGLMPGTQFQIVSIAPFGDPIQMRVNDFALSLRKKELALLELEII